MVRVRVSNHPVRLAMYLPVLCGSAHMPSQSHPPRYLVQALSSSRGRVVIRVGVRCIRVRVRVRVRVRHLSMLCLGPQQLQLNAISLSLCFLDLVG